MTFTGSWQSPFFDLHDVYRILAVSLLRYTWCLQDRGSLTFSIYMIFIGSRKSPFFNLHDIYRISARFLFRFTWCLQELASLSFPIYMIFTGSWQSSFFDLHDIHRILGVSFFRFTWYFHAFCLSCLLNVQDLFPHLHVRSIDGNLFFFKLKLFIFRRWWQLSMKTATIKQRYRMNLYFVVFGSFVSLLNLTWWFTIDVHLSLTLKLRLHTCMGTNNWVCVFMF